MVTKTATHRIGGVNISSVVTRTQELESVFQAEMAAGKAGTLTTRTDDDTGIVTVASGHGITDADTVALFWDGGSMYGCTVSATTSTTISIDIGSGGGSVLPTVSSAIVVAKESSHDLAIVGDDMSLFVVGCDNRASVNFLSSIDASLLRYDLAAGEGRDWVSGMDVTNPLAGDTVASVVVANGGTAAKTLKIGVLASTN